MAHVRSACGRPVLTEEQQRPAVSIRWRYVQRSAIPVARMTCIGCLLQHGRIIGHYHSQEIQETWVPVAPRLHLQHLPQLKVQASTGLTVQAASEACISIKGCLHPDQVQTVRGPEQTVEYT